MDPTSRRRVEEQALAGRGGDGARVPVDERVDGPLPGGGDRRRGGRGRGRGGRDRRERAAGANSSRSVSAASAASASIFSTSAPDKDPGDALRGAGATPGGRVPDPPDVDRAGGVSPRRRRPSLPTKKKQTPKKHRAASLLPQLPDPHRQPETSRLRPSLTNSIPDARDPVRGRRGEEAAGRRDCDRVDGARVFGQVRDERAARAPGGAVERAGRRARGRDEEEAGRGPRRRRRTGKEAEKSEGGSSELDAATAIADSALAAATAAAGTP